MIGISEKNSVEKTNCSIPIFPETYLSKTPKSFLFVIENFLAIKKGYSKEYPFF